MNRHSQQGIERFIAIDARKHYLVLGGLNAHMETVLPLRRISIDRFPDWAHKHLQPTDAVVIEATTNILRLRSGQAPDPVRHRCPPGGQSGGSQCLPGQAHRTCPVPDRYRAAARVKTDRRDTLCP